MKDYLIWFDSIRNSDTGIVGGKNASLGEMISQLSALGVSVPPGFATTADAYRDFLAENGLDRLIDKALATLDINDVQALKETGFTIRQAIINASLSQRLEDEISAAYRKMEQDAGGAIAVAVRSSATAEDLPEASFAGQQETYLNISGTDKLLEAIKKVFASLYTDRAISYRVHHGFNHDNVKIALSAGIQKMVRSDISSSGVIFTLDTESGFQGVIFITASYGLGETIVQGAVDPDEFYVDKRLLKQNKYSILRRRLGSKTIKMILDETADSGYSTQTVDVAEQDRSRFCISDRDITTLAQYAATIEAHYQRPMDIEWARDGSDGKIYIVQARPETVETHKLSNKLETYELQARSEILVSGRSIGQRIGTGQARVIDSLDEISSVKEGDVLVTDMTDPDWEPIMKRASAIVTNRGGRTCHAAIVARELGLPTVVGTGNATRVITNNQAVTVSCAEGETGYVYNGKQPFRINTIELDQLPDIPVKIMLNVANPDLAFDLQYLPNAGIGLARLEFIINRMIGVHPKALLNFEQQDSDTQQQILNKSTGYANPTQFYIEKIREGVATLAAAFFPKPVIVRLSDFKSNEYAHMVGGSAYEPSEENPMIGFRGASRYLSTSFRDCFDLECRAIKMARDDMGLNNIAIMVPFIRTAEEARQIIMLLEENGLKRGSNELKIYFMCELPSNCLQAPEFLEYCDGFSIGSNDLTQMTLGLDRDSELVAHLFDEQENSVKSLMHMAITACHQEKKYIGICGQGPSDKPELAKWLMRERIDSISLNPDTVIATWQYLAGLSK